MKKNNETYAPINRKKKVVVRLSIPEELYERLVKESDKMGISISPMATIFLQQVVEARDNMGALQQIIDMAKQQQIKLDEVSKIDENI